MDTVIVTVKPSWHSYFMNIAKAVSLRSPDPKKQVGAILVDENKRIVSTGYNGLPSGFPEYQVDWNNRETVKHIIIHAELNVILYAKSDLKDTILFCTLSPCKECIKIIKASGIKIVYYHEQHKDFEIVIQLANAFEMQLIQIT